MAGDPVIEQSSMDSKEDCLLGFTTTNGGNFILFGGDEPTLRYYDSRGRCMAVLPGDRLVGLTKALLEAQKVIMPVDEVVADMRNRLAQRDVIVKLHPKRYPAFQGTTTCGTCGTPWPCATLQALGVDA